MRERVLKNMFKEEGASSDVSTSQYGSDDDNVCWSLGKRNEQRCQRVSAG